MTGGLDDVPGLDTVKVSVRQRLKNNKRKIHLGLQSPESIIIIIVAVIHHAVFVRRSFSWNWNGNLPNLLKTVLVALSNAVDSFHLRLGERHFFHVLHSSQFC
jgi:hypothetical protein